MIHIINRGVALVLYVKSSGFDPRCHFVVIFHAFLRFLELKLGSIVWGYKTWADGYGKQVSTLQGQVPASTSTTFLRNISMLSIPGSWGLPPHFG